MMKPKPDAMRMKARGLMEPGIMAMNGKPPEQRPASPDRAAAKAMNQKPQTFARGGAVKKRVEVGESAAHEAKETPAQERAEQKAGKYLYRKGGKVKRFAQGGAAKVRRGVATESGAPKRAVKPGRMVAEQ